MQAVVIEAPREIGVTDVPDPSPGAGEIVVAVRACGICGTDLHLVDGEFPGARYPLIPGHEFAGEVVAVGSGASDALVGTPVAVDPSLYCGHCRYCRVGHFNLCERWGAIGVTVPGAAAEFVSVPSVNARPLPTDFTPSLGALIEPLACAVHGYDLVKAKLGDRLLIYGAGTMGLLLLLLARRVGAVSPTVVEPNPARRDKALLLGAKHVAANATELDGDDGYDIVMDATGVVAAIEDGVRRVRRGGTFLQFGVAAADATARISPFRIYNDEITMIGSMAILASYDRACDLAVEGELELLQLVSDQLPLTAYPDALDHVRRGDGYKVHIVPS